MRPVGLRPQSRYETPNSMRTALATSVLLSAASLFAQSPLTTTYAGGNGLGAGSTIYFDLQVTLPITITQIDVNSSSTASTAGSIDVRTCPTTYVGNDTNAAAWTLAASGPAVAAGAGVATPVTLTSPLALLPGNYGLAITFNGIAQNYSNGTGTAVPGSGSNQTYTTPELTLLAGASSGGAPGTAICCVPRVFNGALYYSLGSGAFATRTPFGAGCLDTSSSFYETFGNGLFDLAGQGGLTNSLLLNPTGGGGYAVLPGSNTFFTPTSANLGMTDDSVNTQTLPFPWVTPTGVTTTVVISSNGFLWSAPNTVNGCCNGDPVQFFTQAERYAILWQDLNPTIGGSVHFDVDPSGQVAYVTWLNVPEYAQAANLNTFQVAIFASGAVEYRWQQCGNISHTVLVGYTRGLGARNPGAIDISATVPFVTQPDRIPLALNTSARPQIGTTINCVTTNVPSTSGVGLLGLGFGALVPPFDLTLLGAPGCFQHVGVSATAVYIPTAGTGTLPFTIPNNQALAGVRVFAQSIAVDPTINALGAITSNGLDLLLNPN